jgi:hypothetical protein
MLRVHDAAGFKVHIMRTQRSAGFTFHMVTSSFLFSREFSSLMCALFSCDFRRKMRSNNVWLPHASRHAPEVIRKLVRQQAASRLRVLWNLFPNVQDQHCGTDPKGGGIPESRHCSDAHLQPCGFGKHTFSTCMSPSLSPPSSHCRLH